jgi:hypothetical protein
MTGDQGRQSTRVTDQSWFEVLFSYGLKYQ